MNSCRNCRFWTIDMWTSMHTVETAPNGECGLTKWYRPPKKPLMVAVGDECECVETQPDFGCVQWEERLPPEEQAKLQRRCR